MNRQANLPVLLADDLDGDAVAGVTDVGEGR
jgi:hypothetical protein